MRTKPVLALCLAAAFFVPTISMAGNLESSRRSQDRQDREMGTARKVYRGEAVLRTDQATLVVALDEADEEGRMDGRVDHVFTLWAVEMIIHPMELRDPAAEIEIRRDRARILLHSEQLEVELLTTGARPDPEPLYPLQAVRYAAEFVRYSGPTVRAYFLADFEDDTRAIIGSLQRPRAAFDLLDALTPPPASGTSTGGCKSSCSAECSKGSCAAMCQVGCAVCGCSSQTPPSSPFCYCN